MTQIIEVVISTDGQTKIETKGFQARRAATRATSSKRLWAVG